MNTKLFSLVLAFVLTTIMSSAQVPTFLSSSLIPSNYSACTNPITMGFGVTAVDFNIGDPITFYIDFGDGTNYSAPVQYITNVYDSLFGTVTHTYANAGVYSPTMTITGPGATPLLVTWFWGANTLTVGPPLPCGNISGSVFNDMNVNCTMENGEELFYHHIGVSLAGNIIADGYTDAAGNYSIDYPFILGQTYIVSYLSNINFASCMGVSCPLTQTYAVNILNSTNNNFGLTLNGANYDMNAAWTSINTGILNAGFNKSFYFSFTNFNCPMLGGDLTVNLDPSVNYLSATPIPTSVVGNTLTWNMATMGISQILEVNTFVPLANINNIPFIIGDSVCHTSMITGAITGDWNLLNNTRTSCFYIGTSYDPNDKKVSPEGVGPGGNVNFGTEFSYDIRFQNTGNSPAINVVVLDTLESDLDPSSVVVTGRSHYMIFTQNGNILKFEFPNIMLPDSTTDFDASQGGVSFKVKHKTGLTEGTPINNKAHIYFDLNAPIITNTTNNTLVNNVSGIGSVNNANGFQVYPNPITTEFKVVLDDFNSKIIRCELQNQIGEKLQKISTSSNSLNLSIANYSAGIYFITITDNKGNIFQKKLVKE
ncbi:MAG: T9SS type A sorting domain-containing protein [Bacteroidetes bacterium]|nr:T9SS type A sorting domain-containing protein [Bacteroidota bacterium]